MKSIAIGVISVWWLGASMLSVLPQPTTAATIIGHVRDDGRGDKIGQQILTGELGDVALFPTVNAISYHDHRANSAQLTGVPDDGVANDWTVHMTNVSGIAWKDLFFVADAGATIGNADGQVEDLIGAPGKFTDAFRIDGTATAGINNNLLTESILADEIFQAGESWEFSVTNFDTGLISSPPTLVSPGLFAGSSPIANFGTNASVLGTPVPEPNLLSVMGIIIGGLLMRRVRPYAKGR